MSSHSAGFSTRIPGEHALGRTILLQNHSYSVLLYNYSCSIPFLELGLLLQRQRSHLLKLPSVAVMESHLNQFALNSSSCLVPQFYYSPLSKKNWEESRLVLHLPLWSQKQSIWAVRPHYLTPSVPLQGHKPQGHIPAARVCQGKTPLMWELTCHRELALSPPPPE